MVTIKKATKEEAAKIEKKMKAIVLNLAKTLNNKRKTAINNK